MQPIKSPKKLIEAALPLDAINAAAAREKSIRHGHPSTLHLWWARRPLAAARAVIFAQMVNDPGYERQGLLSLSCRAAVEKSAVLSYELGGIASEYRLVKLYLRLNILVILKKHVSKVIQVGRRNSDVKLSHRTVLAYYIRIYSDAVF